MSVTSDVIEDDKGQQILLVGVQSDGTPTKLLCDSNGKLKISTTGGGGSGTVTSIATSSPITGGTITSTGTIGISAATTSAAGSMSSADKTKLDGIEASADVTDSANVTAAGALMDSEVTNLAFVKGLTGGISDGNVLTANNAVADDDFLRIDGTEVEGLTAAEVRTALNVENGADVTDATNVAAAGALMKTAIVNTNASPASSAADSGEYFYITSGSFTLPDITSVGEQYVVLNNKGSSLTIAKHSSDSIVGATSIADDKAATIVAVTTSTWFVVG